MKMRICHQFKLGALIAVLAVPLWPAAIVQAADEQRAPPEARTAGTLGTQVQRSIMRIQEMMTPEDPEDEPDLVGAKEELDRLYERRYERMNDFEKSTILNFYTNYYLATENYPETLRIFEQILTIETLRESTRLRTLRSLGQLYSAEENWSESIRNYELWRASSLEEDDLVYKGLSYGHYQLEQYVEALPYWISYMEFLLDEGSELSRSDYSYLNGIYFQIEDYDRALELTKTMIMLFDNTRDWQNLSAIYSSLDDFERALHALNLAYLKGHIDDENRYVNLGQSMAGVDIPYSGTKIIQAGFDAGIVEQDEDNLISVTQMLMIASEFERALGPAQSAAELIENGDGFDTVGYINFVLHDYQAAVDAFEIAVDKGDLSNPSNTLQLFAMSLVALDDFGAASEITRQWAESGDRSDQESANNYRRAITNIKARFDILASRREEARDFYESYPPLQ